MERIVIRPIILDARRRHERAGGRGPPAAPRAAADRRRNDESAQMPTSICVNEKKATTMPVLTLGQHLDLLAQGGETLVVPTPPACQSLWERGKVQGLRLGALYVLRAPLHPRTTASYSHQSGDVWVVDHPDDPERTQRSLLHELAHACKVQRGWRTVSPSTRTVTRRSPPSAAPATWPSPGVWSTS